MATPRDRWPHEARESWLTEHPGLGEAGISFATAEPDAGWRARFERMHADRGLPASLDAVADTGFRSLVHEAKSRLDGLLAHGGWAVCHPALDDDLDRVVARGVLLEGAGARLARGEPSRCHGNAARLWRAEPGSRAIMTGYALSPDGLWREHSWIAAAGRGGAPHLVETTQARVAYFGFLRTPEEAVELLPEWADRWPEETQEERLERMRARLHLALRGVPLDHDATPPRIP